MNLKKPFEQCFISFKNLSLDMILEFHNISFVWHDCCHTFATKITKVFIFNFLILKMWQFFPKNLAKLVEFTL